ncbi:MAG: 30S ribosomal protein S15 [Patescibacteria group bacterium]
MLSAQKKQRIINKYKTHAKDTGSAEVQIAILTEEIKELTKHLNAHKQDHSSRRGLLKKLGERRRLLRYLESDNLDSFEKLVKDLSIKISRRKTMDEFEQEAEPEIAEPTNNQ